MSPRPHCYRCDKPREMCLCQHLEPLPNRVGVHVLQHPHERRHALNTVRLLRLGLAHIDVHVLPLRGTSSVCPAVDLPEGTGLLYLTDDAVDLETLDAAERPRHLVVIDGTWDQAHRLFRDNPWIAALPRYRLDPEHGSRYRIRTEPRAECLSTLESVVAALRRLEPELHGLDTLVDAFDAMIDAQIEASARPSNRPERSPRQRRPRTVPDALSDPDARIVVVYAEAEPTPHPDPRGPVRLCAASLHDGRVFDRWVQVDTPPDAHVASKMGLPAGALDTAGTRSQVLDAFDAFLGRDQGLVLVSWSPWTHAWLTARPSQTPCLQLKQVWAELGHGPIPALEILVDRLALPIPDLGVRGRAGERLAQAHAMASHVVHGAADGS